MRVAVPLPIRVGHAEIFSETALEAAGADTVLVISTAAPDHALLVRTVYVGSGGEEPGVAVDVTLTPAGRATTHRVLPDVPVTHARGRCLSDHAAVVQSALKALTGAHVSVHVGDDAVLLTSQAFPPAADEPQQP